MKVSRSTRDSNLIEKKVDGKYHCINGPALVREDRQGWFMMDMPHRYYGPTTNWRETGDEIAIGDGYWFIHGVMVR